MVESVATCHVEKLVTQNRQNFENFVIQWRVMR